jgi:hypothetical protein
MWKGLSVAAMLGLAACGSSAGDNATEQSAGSTADELGSVARDCGAHERVENCGPFNDWHETGRCCAFDLPADEGGSGTDNCPWVENQWLHYGGHTEIHLERRRLCTSVTAPAGHRVCRDVQQQTNLDRCSVACRDYGHPGYSICSDSEIQ